ncbi:helix-turn-helix domain-containing protein [Streptomyces atacamensis]|uniref:helix-turn-helix domain-containing protein n=1 Tax=Streptomyces atacamensis TaxID=531966 RepID=UPI00399C65F7
MSSLQENVRTHRRRAGMSQEQLAEAAGLSVGVVRKVEQGGDARVETLHMLARALGTTTSSLFATEALDPVHTRDGDGPKLMELRRALMPPVGLAETLVETEEPPPSPRSRGTSTTVTRCIKPTATTPSPNACRESCAQPRPRWSSARTTRPAGTPSRCAPVASC